MRESNRQRRRWRCPECGKRYRIRKEIADPKSCRSCRLRHSPAAAAATSAEPKRWSAQMPLFVGLAAVLIAVAWSARKPAGNPTSHAADQLENSKVPAQPARFREAGSPRIILSEKYNDAALKESLKRLERENKGLLDELENIYADKELELDARKRAKTDAEKDREQLIDELEMARTQRVLLDERLRELEEFSDQAEAEIRALQTRISEVEDATLPENPAQQQ